MWSNNYGLIDKELITQLVKQVEYLTRRVKELEAKLSKYENPRNSNNSSVPPSQDLFRKTKSLGVKSNKPQGGQKGHKGSKTRNGYYAKYHHNSRHYLV